MLIPTSTPITHAAPSAECRCHSISTAVGARRTPDHHPIDGPIIAPLAMMQPEIRRADAAKEFTSQENCFILEMGNDASDPDVSIARARVRPGVTTEWHRLASKLERHTILPGPGTRRAG